MTAAAGASANAGQAGGETSRPGAAAKPPSTACPACRSITGWVCGLVAGAFSLADFHGAFMLVAGLAVGGLADSLRLAPDAAAFVSGHGRSRAR